MITVQNNWKEYEGRLKTPTVIKYKDETYTSVESWGFPALAEKPKKKRLMSSFPSSKTSSSKPIELFKLHLLDSLEEKPFLPSGLDFRKVIKDYMKKLCETIIESLDNHWLNLDLHSNILIVLTVRDRFY